MGRATWTSGEPALDRHLPGGGLDAAAVHEIKPVAHGDWPAALAFAVGLAVRRRTWAIAQGLPPAPVLWCTTTAFVAEHGGLYGPGLAGLGLPPKALIVVEVPREADMLWALEEGLRSGAPGLVVGMMREIGLTPSRRLSLAAAASNTPALLVTHPAHAPAPATSTRLRLRRLPSPQASFDEKAPGRARLGLAVERCRGGSSFSQALTLELEWCHVTHRFHLAPSLADRAHAAPKARQRTHG